MDQPTKGAKRVRGRFVAIGLAVLIASVVTFALTMWFSGREPNGPIQAVQPLGGGEAALLRRGFEERGYTHLVVWSIERGQRWSEALFGVPEDPSLTQIQQGDVDLVALRAREARGHVEVHAFDRATGRFAWRGGRATHENAIEHPGGLPPFASRSLIVGDGVLFVVHGGDAVEVVVLALDDGAERGRVELPAESEGGTATSADSDARAARMAARVGDAVVLSTGSSVYRVTADGASERLGSTALGHCTTSTHVFLGDPLGLRIHHGADVQVLGDELPMEVYACAELPNAEGVDEAFLMAPSPDGAVAGPRAPSAQMAWIVARAPSGDLVLQRYEGQLRGGYALPAIARVERLLRGPEGLLLMGDGALWRVGAESVRVADEADEVFVLGADVVARTGETFRAGERSVQVPGAGLAAAGEWLWVASGRELVVLDGGLTARFGGEHVDAD